MGALHSRATPGPLLPRVISLCREASAIIDGDMWRRSGRAHALLYKAEGLIYDFHRSGDVYWDWEEHPLLPALTVATESAWCWSSCRRDARERSEEARSRALALVGVVIRSATAVSVVDDDELECVLCGERVRIQVALGCQGDHRACHTCIKAWFTRCDATRQGRSCHMCRGSVTVEVLDDDFRDIDACHRIRERA